MNIERKILMQRHECHDHEMWADYSALYKGGKAFRERATRFIAKNPKEDYAAYGRRVGVISYHCYLGQIIDFLVGFLRGANMAVRVRDQEVLPEHYGQMKEDADGRGTDLKELACYAATEGMQKGVAWWRLVRPRPTGAEYRSLADFEGDGQNDVRLECTCPENILDWEFGEDKELDYVVTYEKKIVRVAPTVGRTTVVERWEVIDRVSVAVFEVRYEKGRAAPTTIPQVDGYAHGFDGVPFVHMDFCKLFLADRISVPLSNIVRKSSAMQWNLLQSCYAMPCFKVKDAEKPPTMGATHFLMIGVDEEMVWLAPPTAHLETLKSDIASDKDEIYRVVNQMAQGVDNSASAVGRSGMSKAVDAESTKVIVTALGLLLSEQLQRALKRVSRARGENDLEFSIEGFDKFDSVEPLILSEAVDMAINTVDIQSLTFQHEAKKRIALALLADAPQKIKDKIRAEIDASPMTERPDPMALAEAKAKKPEKSQ